jgi:hypothetical protein
MTGVTNVLNKNDFDFSFVLNSQDAILKIFFIVFPIFQLAFCICDIFRNAVGQKEIFQFAIIPF